MRKWGHVAISSSLVTFHCNAEKGYWKNSFVSIVSDFKQCMPNATHIEAIRNQANSSPAPMRYLCVAAH